jgi:hypothetical protein
MDGRMEQLQQEQERNKSEGKIIIIKYYKKVAHATILIDASM